MDYAGEPVGTVQRPLWNQGRGRQTPLGDPGRPSPHSEEVRRALQRSLIFLNRRWRYDSQVTNLLKEKEIPNYDILASIVDEAAFVTNKHGWEKTTLRWTVYSLDETTSTCPKTPCTARVLSYVEDKVHRKSNQIANHKHHNTITTSKERKSRQQVGQGR